MVLKHFTTRQFLHYLFAGGIAAIVNFAVGLSLAGMLPLHGDIVVGYLSGMLTAFILFERKVFGSHAESRKKSAILFVIVNMFGLAQTWVIYALLKEWFFPLIAFSFFPDLIARAVAIATPALTSYIGHKFFTFKQ